MRFHSINITNFCSVGNVVLDYTNQRLVIVNGKNMDTSGASSNGSGKSTVTADALCWALFGKTIKGGGVNAVVPNGKGSGTCVEVKFSSNNKDYVVSRYRKHKEKGSGVYITEDGKDITKSTATDNDAMIQEILGINMDTFLYTTVIGQGNMFRFSLLTDQSRKEILEGIAKSAIYESARVASREKLNKHKLDVATKDAEIKSLGEKIEYASNTLKQYAEMQEQAQIKYANEQLAAQTRIEAGKLAYAEALAAFTAAESLYKVQMDNHMSMREVFDSSIKSARNQIDVMVGKIAGDNAILTKANQKKTRYSSLGGGTCSNCGQIIDENHIKKEIEILDKEMSLLKNSISTDSSNLNNIRNSLTAMQQQLSQSELAISQLKSNVSMLSSRVELAKADIQKAELQASSIKALDFSSNVASSKASIESFYSKMELILKEKATSEKLAKYAESWIARYQEIRVMTMDNLLLFLNEKLSQYCSILCDADLEVKFSHNEKGKIDLDVSTPGGTYVSASGGERDRIDICIAFALLALARQSTNWTSNVIILDEIATAVDDAGIEKLMQLIDTIMDDVESIFLISHNPIFASYGDKLLTVVREDGVSRVDAHG